MDSLFTHFSAILVAGLVLLYVVGGAFHRLYLCPVARFPGPRLAALTFWYEFYYDVVRKGRYTWEIAAMHKKYGPIVRINPFELHVSDPAFYDELYVGRGSRRTEKWPWSAKMFGTTLAAVGTASHELHRVRRAALNPFFSRRSVARLEPVIAANVDKLRRRLDDEFAGTGTPVNVVDAFTALSADVIGSFAFGRPYGFLDAEDFNPGWHRLMLDLSRGTHLMKQFGWLYAVMTRIPQKLVSILHPLTKELFDVQNGITQQIRDIKASKSTQKDPAAAIDDDDAGQPPTILHDILFSAKLPPSELTDLRLTEEGFTLLGAGTVTTAHTLTTTLFHILTSPSKLCRLRAEISSLPTPQPTWAQLEQLPYLAAVIAEGLRMSYGVSHRLPRVSPDTPLRVPGTPAESTIPPSTPVSMTQMFIHDDPALFPDPASFLPERWLESETGATDAAAEKERVAHARRFLVPFSRGTRQCVGMNLAYAELYLTLGTLCAPVERGGLELELWETGREDVEVAHDFFNPAPSTDSKGVRVMVKGRREGDERISS